MVVCGAWAWGVDVDRARRFGGVFSAVDARDGSGTAGVDGLALCRAAFVDVGSVRVLVCLGTARVIAAVDSCDAGSAVRGGIAGADRGADGDHARCCCAAEFAAISCALRVVVRALDHVGARDRRARVGDAFWWFERRHAVDS